MQVVFLNGVATNMNIRWLDRIIENPSPVSDEAFAHAQREFGVTFPADYREIVKQHQGALPLPNGIEHPDASTGVEYLYHFEDEPYSQSIIGAYYPIGHALPSGVIPFAAGIGGDYFCFDFRDQPDSPIVSVWLHDGPGELITLANSFTEWLGLLCE